MTGSSIFDYIHQQDHVEVAEQLGLSLSNGQGMASPSSGASDEGGGSHGTNNPDGKSLFNYIIVCYLHISTQWSIGHSTIKWFEFHFLLRIHFPTNFSLQHFKPWNCKLTTELSSFPIIIPISRLSSANTANYKRRLFLSISQSQSIEHN